MPKKATTVTRKTMFSDLGDNISVEWQLWIPEGHAVGPLHEKPVVHIFTTKQEALNWFADFVVAPAVKAGKRCPHTDLRLVIRHAHMP